MKTTITIIFLLFAVVGYSQIANVPIHGDTIVNGSKFSYVFTGNIRVFTADSINNDTVVPGYISLLNSKAEIIVNRSRIVNGDTIQRIEGVTVPLSEISTRFSAMINSVEFRRAFKKAIRQNSVTRRLNQE